MKRSTQKLCWHVRLGPLEWARHTYARLDTDPLRLLGAVYRGPQMGALAITDEGQYVQVVGDFLAPLNKGQILRAIAKARIRETYAAPQPIAASVATSVVIVKRRRIPVV